MFPRRRSPCGGVYLLHPPEASLNEFAHPLFCMSNNFALPMIRKSYILTNTSRP